MNVPAGATPSRAALRLSMSACTASWPTYETGPSQEVKRTSCAIAIVCVICSAKSGCLVEAHHRRGNLLNGPLAAETGQAVLDIGGVARLADLAVVDDVDAGVDLPAHRLVDGATNLLGKSVSID